MKRQADVKRWTELGYIVCLTAFLAYRSFFNTMIRLDYGIKRCKPAEYCWLALMMLLIVIRTLYLRCYSKVELLIAVSFCISALLSWRHARVYWFLMVPLLIVGAKGIPFDRIVRTFLITVGTVIGIALILSLTGVISNLSYVRDIYTEEGRNGAPRYAFGTTYPTTFSEFVFFLSAAWLYFRRKVVQFYDVALFVAIAVFLYKGSGAVTDAVCVVALAMIAVLMIVLRHMSAHAGEVVHKLCAPLVAVTGLCAAVMTALMAGYDKTNETWVKLNEILHHRISLGSMGWKYIGVYPFGTKVKYRMTGGDPSLMGRKDYFNLDCSYHMILVNYGIIIFLFIIAFFTVAALRAWQKQDLVLLLTIVVISLECVMENRMIQPQYDIFLLMFFADIQSARGEKYLILSRDMEGGGIEDRNQEARETSALAGE